MARLMVGSLRLSKASIVQTLEINDHGLKDYIENIKV
jgi:hypothetical protein